MEGSPMKIAESSISLGAEHVRQEKHSIEEKLTVWKTDREPVITEGDNRNNGPSINVLSVIAKHESDKVELSSAAINQSQRSSPIAEEISEEDKLISDLNIRILKAFIERITGKKINLYDPDSISKEIDTNGNNGMSVAERVQDEEGVVGDESAGYGLVYEYHESYQEHERMDFSANGVIKTEDGTEIVFNTSLSMSRSFIEENHITIRAGDALKDPLVVNFDGRPTAISNTEFAFDIDSDGTKDQLHFVESGSGFLALDKNKDGEINNGGELFGARTGNGFRELSQFDDDSNDWIDENDQIYDSLRIWRLDENGTKSLMALGQMGIGAIYLGSVNSPFSIKNEDNGLQAQVRSTGMFLKENGTAGTVQQVDLVV